MADAPPAPSGQRSVTLDIGMIGSGLGDGIDIEEAYRLVATAMENDAELMAAVGAARERAVETVRGNLVAKSARGGLEEYRRVLDAAFEDAIDELTASMGMTASALLGRPSRNDAALASASSPSSTTATPGAREAATAIATGPNATQRNLCSTRREPAAFSWDRQKRACAGPLSGSVNSTGPNTSPDTTILLTVSKPRLLPSQAIRLGG